MMWCSASYFSAIFEAADDSSTLFANFIETALIFRSGFTLRSNDKTNVESTPPLIATETSLEFIDFNLVSISSNIEFSIKSRFGDPLVDSKSFQVFLGKFGFMDGSYLRVRIFTTDELEISTT